MAFSSGKPIKTTTAMRKIYAFLMSAVALVGFAACTEGLNDEGIRVEVNKEEVSIFASFDEDDTRMTLNDKTPVWEKGDVITINGFEFTAQESGTSVQFKGEVDASLIGAPFTAYYGGETVADEQVAREGDMPKNTPAMAEGDAFESGMTIEFFNIAALLKFTPTFAGDITFDTLEGEAITITGCEANKEYYVAVTPTIWEKGVKVTTVCDIFCKEGAVGQEIERNKIYNIGTISRKEAPYKIIGTQCDWDFNSCALMYESTNYYVAPGYKLDKGTNEYKFVAKTATGWSAENYGTGSKSTAGYAYRTWSGGNNITANNGTYDIYFSKDKAFYFILTSGTAVTDDTIKLVTDSYGIVGNIKNNNWSTNVPLYVCGKFLAAKNIQPAASNFAFKIRQKNVWNQGEEFGTTWDSCPIEYVIPLDGSKDIIYKNLNTSKMYDIYTNFLKVQLLNAGSATPTALN